MDTKPNVHRIRPFSKQVLSLSRNNEISENIYTRHLYKKILFYHGVITFGRWLYAYGILMDFYEFLTTGVLLVLKQIVADCFKLLLKF